jgi:transcriptional regulator with XRE-family HTH domain
MNKGDTMEKPMNVLNGLDLLTMVPSDAPMATEQVPSEMSLLYPDIDSFLTLVKDNDCRSEAIEEIQRQRMQKGSISVAKTVPVAERISSAPRQPSPVAMATPGKRGRKPSLRKIRESLGLNQAEFAARLNITQAYVSQMESGKAVVSDKVRCQLATLEGKETEVKAAPRATKVATEKAATRGRKPGLKKIRESMGLNQREFAAVLKITPAYVSQMESGVVGVSPKVRERIAAL